MWVYWKNVVWYYKTVRIMTCRARSNPQGSQLGYVKIKFRRKSV